MKSAIIFALLASGWFELGGAARDGPVRSVTGTVRDKFGNALPTAVVELENTRTMAVASYITHADGRYYFHQLSTNIDYTLRARYRTLWSKTKLLNKFDGGARVTIDLEVPAR